MNLSVYSLVCRFYKVFERHGMKVVPVFCEAMIPKHIQSDRCKTSRNTSEMRLTFVDDWMMVGNTVNKSM